MTALNLQPTGEVLGATIEGVDLSLPFDDATLAAVVRALAEHDVLCFSCQTLDAAALRRSEIQGEAGS